MTTTIAVAMGSVPNVELAVPIVRTGFISPACSASVRTLPAQSRLSSRSSKYSYAAAKGGEPNGSVSSKQNKRFHDDEQPSLEKPQSLSQGKRDALSNSLLPGFSRCFYQPLVFLL